MKENIEVILVDIGNTQTKSAVVEEGVIQETRSWGRFEELRGFYTDQVPFMICSTKDEPVKLSDKDVMLSHDMPLPIALDYETPETLGTDRIAAAVGAMEVFPDVNNLIIDFGTCITMDLVDEYHVFRGGIISPGLKMRIKSMAHYTAKLPDISEEFEKMKGSLLGRSTKECLYSGSYWGTLNELHGVIETFQKKFTTLNVILTGGDAHYFESNLKAHIFAGSKIVQRGLYRIWKYQ